MNERGRLLTIIVAGGLAVGGCGKSEQATFDFHTGLDGRVVWRCNRRTGEVHLCRYGLYGKDVHWERVKDTAEPSQPGPNDEIIGLTNQIGRTNNPFQDLIPKKSNQN